MHEHPADTTDQSLVGVSFDTTFRAQEFLVAAAGLAADGRLKLKDAVTVTKDEQGNTNAHETIDPSPGRAALSGAMWSGLLGLVLGGPVGWIAGLAVGAGAGAVSAKVLTPETFPLPGHILIHGGGNGHALGGGGHGKGAIGISLDEL